MKLIVVIAMSVTFLFAGSSIFIVADPNVEPVNKYILVKADYAVAEIVIGNNYSDALRRLASLKKTKIAFEKTIQNRNGFSVIPGKVNLSANTSKFSGVGYSSNIYMRVLIDLSDFNHDFIEATYALREFVDRMKLPSKTYIRIRPISLAVENPEQYRSELLQMIHTQMDSLKVAFGKDISIELSGLESTVKVGQYSDRKVSVFIDYKMLLETK